MQEVVINQFFGLGDIFFIEPIYRYYHNEGYKVVAPILPEYLWVQEYIPYVEFKDKTTYPYSYETVEQPEDGRLHIPLRFAHPLLRGYELHYGDERENWMGDKYLYLGLDKDMWREMSFVRNTEKEEALFKELGINTDFPYNFVNEHFGGAFEKVVINPSNGLKNIKLQKIEGYTLLDWLLVMQRAENIYTVETSIMWLIEAFPTEAKSLHLYPRLPWLGNTNYIHKYLKKNWTFYDETNL